MRWPDARIALHPLNVSDPKITDSNAPRLSLILKSLQGLIHLFDSGRPSTWRMDEKEVDITILAVDLVYTIQALLVCLVRTATGAQDLGRQEDFIPWYA